MKKYPKYKETDIGWIGEIPEHWTIKKMGYIGSFDKGQGISKSQVGEQGEGVVLYGDIYTTYSIKVNHFCRKALPEVTENATVVKKGDILLTGSGETKEEIGKCIVYLGEKDAYAGGDVIIFRPECSNTLFLSYLLNSHSYEYKKATLSKGQIVVHVYSSQLRDIPIVLPDCDEQDSIASYLDHKTALIDDLISKNNKLIKLLEEKRKAIINQAVTKGLDPNVKMKDSGVEWIGEIPEHWEVNRMKWLVNIQTGESNTEDKVDNGKYPLFVRSPIIERSDKFVFDCEAILTAGDGVGVCKVFHHYKGKFDAHQRVYVLNNYRKVMGRFLYFYLKEYFIKEVKKLSAKSTVDSLRLHMFQNFLVVIPPITEQANIIDEIDKEHGQISELLRRTKEQNMLLSEYRRSLISHVVTGKVDVRDEAKFYTENNNV